MATWRLIQKRPPVSESALGDRLRADNAALLYSLNLLKQPMPTNPIPDVGWRLDLIWKVWVAGLELIGRYSRTEAGMCQVQYKFEPTKPTSQE
jgi:hypothetical protein